MTLATSLRDTAQQARPAAGEKANVVLPEHIIEIISDSGEGAQRCGQSLGAIAAKMGNGIWTVEIIPAEIRPPARSVAGASGNRIRLGSRRVTNGGDETGLVVAFNEQVLLGRVRSGDLKSDCIILLESMWRENSDPNVVASYVETYDQLMAAGFRVYEIPMERECRKLVADARRGKNMFALGMLCNLYSLDLQLARDADRAHLRQEGRERDQIERQAAGGGSRMGGSKPRLQVPHPGVRCDRAADRGQRKHGFGARHPGIGHGGLRHVSDHAGHLGVALPERCLREGRRRGPSGGGRDCGVHVRDRGFVCRQMHGHHYVRPRLFAQAGGDGACRDGRDSTGRRECAARRPQHRSADERGAGRSTDGHVRQPRRRAQGGHGAEPRSRTASTRSSPHARSPRLSIWWWSS